MNKFFFIALFALMAMAGNAQTVGQAGQAQGTAPTAATTTATTAAFESKCDALCKRQKEIEAKRHELEQSLRDLEYEKAQVEDAQTEQVRLTYERDDAAYLTEISTIDYQAALCRAECDRTANTAKAILTSKYKSKWEAVFPTQVVKRCTDRCPSPK
jgi:hypothetical protein